LLTVSISAGHFIFDRIVVPGPSKDADLAKCSGPLLEKLFMSVLGQSLVSFIIQEHIGQMEDSSSGPH